MSQVTQIGSGRFFTRPKARAYDLIDWLPQDLEPLAQNGTEGAELKWAVEFPTSWSPRAAQAFATNYLVARGPKESFKQRIDSVVGVITREGLQENYFASEEDAASFGEELRYILVTQRATFGPAIWSNLGKKGVPRRLADSVISETGDRPSAILCAESPEASDSLSEEVCKAALDSGATILFVPNINTWNTAPKAGWIQAADASGGFIYLDNSSSTWAWLNLAQFLRDGHGLDIEAFKHAIVLLATAQEILIGHAEFADEEIARTTRVTRCIGLGYTNLASMLMGQGLAYDSAEGRAQAAMVTALMTGQAYAVSAKLAKSVGPFPWFDRDRSAVLNVLRRHREQITHVNPSLVSEELYSAATASWDEAIELGERYGIRNAQVSMLAQSAVMDEILDSLSTCTKPPAALLKTAELSLPEREKLMQMVQSGLMALGYTEESNRVILQYIDDRCTTVGAPGLLAEHQAIFQHLFAERLAESDAELAMAVAVQPYISGGVGGPLTIGKGASADEARRLVTIAWRSGLKSLTLPPLSQYAVPQEAATRTKDSAAVKDETKSLTGGKTMYPTFRPLPRQRNSRTYAVKIGGANIRFTVGEYEDGAPGELTVLVAKQETSISSYLDAFAAALSLGLQHGVPLAAYVGEFVGLNFPPAGATDDEEVADVSSAVDYIMRRMALDYLSFDDRQELGLGADGQDDKQTVLLPGELS